MNSSRKLQVFVSSTYKDLIRERQAAVEAILQAGHIPAGMELFSAGDESQWETIRRWIDDSDALLLILGERYGSLESKSGKSYTQLEYEYALSQGKRVFALVLDETWVGKKYEELKADATDRHRHEHSAFKDLVLSKMSAFVGDEKDVKIEVLRSLAEIASDDSLGGWVKASNLADSQSLVIELRKTIEDLRARPQSGTLGVEDLTREIDAHIQDLKHLEVYWEVVGKDGEVKKKMQSNAFNITWEISPYLFDEWHRVNQEWQKMFLETVYPWLSIWNMMEFDEDREMMVLAPKGTILMNKIRTTSLPEGQQPKFEEVDRTSSNDACANKDI